MTALVAVRCTACGGTVRATVGLPRCLFCGAAQLVPTDPADDTEPPVGHLAFEIDADAADAGFRTFATSSFWYPSDLRRARIALHRLQLPAWAWSGRIETHWTGLVRAPETRSDKRPVSGVDHARFDQILVPASNTLRQTELAALGSYDEGRLRSEVPVQDPMELPVLTRAAARTRAQEEMRARHADALRNARSLLEVHASGVASDLSGRPVLVPVWIGAFRYGKRTFRILINGQTGVLVGQAPISVWKVVGVTLVSLLATALVLGLIFGFLAAR